MKKAFKTLFLTLAICLLSAVSVQAASSVKISKANFPDKTIRKIAKSYDKNGNGYLSKKEIKKIKKINISRHAVNTFKGIEYFTSLEEFAYSTGHVSDDSDKKKLDFTKNKQLKKVYIGANRITSIDVGGLKKLEDFDYISVVDAEKRTLKKVNVKGCKKLKYLCIWSSGLSKLDVSTCTSLKSLICADACLKSLDVRKLTKLSQLNVSDNTSLKKLDLRKNKKMHFLEMENTSVSKLQLHPETSLIQLYIANTNISKLDVTSFPKLAYLSCGGLYLTKLDVTQNPKLIGLYCSDNQLKKLDLSASKKLHYLECQNNDIKTLDLSQTKVEEKYLKYDDGVTVIWE